MTPRIPRRVLLAAVTGFFVMAGPAAGSTILQYADQTGNGVTDTWLIDDNLDGQTDRMIVDANEDGYTDAVVAWDVSGRVSGAWVDGNRNGRFEMINQPLYAATGGQIGQYLWSDANEDGRYEAVFWDGQLDGIYEQVYVDTNGDGYADSWRTSATPGVASSTYAASLGEANNAALRILGQAGIWRFTNPS